MGLGGITGGGIGEWLFGGGATKGMLSGPQTGDYQRGYLQNDFMNRQAPMMNTGQADQSRAQQGQLAGMLMQQAQGQRPGAGEMAVNRQVGNAMAQQTSSAQMARGAGAAMAARTAARNQSDIGVNGAGMAAQAQMQDQTNAQNQLGGLLGQTRGQDIQTAGANMQSQQQQQQMQLAALAQMLGVDQAALQQDQAKRAIAAGDKGMMPTLLQVGGQMGAAAASDRRLKTNIKDAREQIDELMDALQPVEYVYIDEARHGVGPRVGVMAQDLLKSEAGSAIVVDLPSGDGIGFDIAKGVSVALAGIARLNERLSKIEERLGNEG